MPFTETDIVDERTRFIEDAHRSLHSFTCSASNTGSAARPATNPLERTVPSADRVVTAPGPRLPKSGHPRGPSLRWYLEKYEPSSSCPLAPRHNILRSRASTQENPALAPGPTRYRGRRAQPKLERRLQGRKHVTALTVQDMHSRFLSTAPRRRH